MKGQNNMDGTHNLLTIRQAAKKFKGLSEYNLRNLIKNNELPYIKSGNRVLIDEDEIHVYIMIASHKGESEID